MENRKEEAEKIISNMEKQSELSKVEELIRDNKISFEHEEKKYRVRLLNLLEKEELDMLRRKKFGQLLKDDDILFEKDLIVQYKKKGYDIEDLDNQMSKIDAEDLSLRMKLGEAIATNSGDAILSEYKSQIENLAENRRVINAQKILLLEFSLETQLLNYVAQIITYLSLEELRNDKWEKMFESIDDFQKYKDNSFINKSAGYSMLLQYSQ